MYLIMHLKAIWEGVHRLHQTTEEIQGTKRLRTFLESVSLPGRIVESLDEKEDKQIGCKCIWKREFFNQGSKRDVAEIRVIVLKDRIDHTDRYFIHGTGKSTK